MCRWPVTGSEIFGVFSGFKNYRLPVMDRLHHAVGIACKDGECVLPFSGLRIFPARPKASHTEGFAARDREFIFWFWTFGCFDPLEEGIGGNDAPTRPEPFTPKLRYVNSLASGIEEQTVGENE